MNHPILEQIHDLIDACDAFEASLKSVQTEYKQYATDSGEAYGIGKFCLLPTVAGWDVLHPTLSFVYEVERWGEICIEESLLPVEFIKDKNQLLENKKLEKRIRQASQSIIENDKNQYAQKLKQKMEGLPQETVEKIEIELAEEKQQKEKRRRDCLAKWEEQDKQS